MKHVKKVKPNKNLHWLAVRTLGDSSAKMRNPMFMIKRLKLFLKRDSISKTDKEIIEEKIVTNEMIKNVIFYIRVWNLLVLVKLQKN